MAKPSAPPLRRGVCTANYDPPPYGEMSIFPDRDVSQGKILYREIVLRDVSLGTARRRLREGGKSSPLRAALLQDAPNGTA